jgi:hypothetical protein
MKLVKRWFMETPEGEIIDGPYRDRKEFYRAHDLYIKQYKYHPVVVVRLMDPSTFTQTELYDASGYQTGRKGGRGTHRAHHAA